VHQVGFTATFTPNTRIECPGQEGFDVDWTSTREGKIVNTAMIDGSVQTVADDIFPNVWRAMATRAGGEVVDSSL